MERCNHNNQAPRALLDDLHDSQARSGRHKCTVCAYIKGYERGIDPNPEPIVSPMEECQAGLSAPRSILKNLPASQAGTGRHKCCVCAYKHGLEAGLADRPSQQ